METQNIATAERPLITSADLLKQWQGHRGLSRKVLAAFPEKELFEFEIGGMRSYAELAKEMMGLASAGINGVLTGEWKTTPKLDHFANDGSIKTKQDMLDAWDEITEQIDTLWPQIPAGRFFEMEAAFGQYENSIVNTIQYFIDNEIHHRGQGYVYLRALGIEPPAFWDR